MVLRPATADLPGGDREGEAVRRSLPNVQIHVGAEADSEKLRACLEIDNGLVHLIAHSAQSYENHMFSTIILGDGPFYPFDLYSSPVRSRLVVLSGCQTGDPGLSYNGDSVSLAHTFLSAGAQEVLASYWPISDGVTGLLMEAFYRGIADGNNQSLALSNAMDDMLTATARFKHWAGFYLIRRR
jgi:CHAT domain-containing protein